MLCIGQPNMQIRRSTFRVLRLLPQAGPHSAALLLFPARVSFHSVDSFHFGLPFASGPSSWAVVLHCGWAVQGLDSFSAPTEWRLFLWHKDELRMSFLWCLE